MIHVGYKAFNGHVFTEMEAQAYNNACADTARVESIYKDTTSELAKWEIEHFKDQQHRLFRAIIGD